MSQNYPQWIDEYAKATHKAFIGMVPSSWGPVDGFAVQKVLANVFIDRMYESISKAIEKNLSFEEVAKTFPSPSTLRASLFTSLFTAYQFAEPKPKEKMRAIVDFSIKLLSQVFKEDIWAYKSNIIHTSKDIEGIISNIPWKDGSPEKAKMLGKLYSTMDAYSHAVYRDFFPQEVHDIYGPYQLNESEILLIKHFPKIYAPELWSDLKDIKYRDIKIFQIYKDVNFECELIGMHSRYQGDLINGLQKYVVQVDGKFISDEETESVRKYFEEVSIKQFEIYSKMTFEELKQKHLDWLMYQYFDFFNLVGLDWHPTKEMREIVSKADISERCIIETFPNYETYINSKDYEVCWLKDLYKN